jgi:magnesium transporter
MERRQLPAAGQPQHVTAEHDLDRHAVELARAPCFSALPCRQRLPHDSQLDVQALVGEVEVGSKSLPYGTVGISLEHERPRLVLPADPVLVEETRQLGLGSDGRSRVPSMFDSRPSRRRKRLPGSSQGDATATHCFPRGRQGNIAAVLRASLFGPRASETVEDWRAALDDLEEDELLWIDGADPSDDELEQLTGAIGSPESWSLRPGGGDGFARVADDGERLFVTVYGAAGSPDDPVLAEVVCVVGKNWVVTLHQESVEMVEEFRERASGGGDVGRLDAPAFLATLLQWVIAGFLRAFEQVEAELEELDAEAMAKPPGDAQAALGRLVRLRRTIGTLRRALAPHREIVTALAHPELDALSTPDSAERFASLERRLEAALTSARDAKDSVIGSFEIVIARTEFRTNEIVKVLTLVTVLLLPASVLAGVMGMNFKAGIFDIAWLFWVVVAAMIAIALVVAGAARARRWI